jgi:hypothetical protein
MRFTDNLTHLAPLNTTDPYSLCSHRHETFMVVRQRLSEGYVTCFDCLYMRTLDTANGRYSVVPCTVTLRERSSWG